MSQLSQLLLSARPRQLSWSCEMDLGTLSTLVTVNPSLQSISLDRLLLFLASTAAIKNDILLIQPSDHSIATTPDILLYSVQSFLSHACGLSISMIVECWSTFKDLVWHCTKVTSHLDPPLSIFHNHGIPHGLGESSLLTLLLGCIALITISQWCKHSIHLINTAQHHPVHVHSRACI